MTAVSGGTRPVPTEVPADDEWLTGAEHDVLAGLTMAKRRADWRLGRWTAKDAGRRGARRTARPCRGAGGRRRRTGGLRRRRPGRAFAQPVAPRRRRGGRGRTAADQGRHRPRDARATLGRLRARVVGRRRAGGVAGRRARRATCGCSAAGRARKRRQRCCGKGCDSTSAMRSSAGFTRRRDWAPLDVTWRSEGIVHHGWWRARRTTG